MKLPNFLHAGDLNSLRLTMGAALSYTFEAKNVYTPIDLPPIAVQLRNEGIDVQFKDIQVLDDGTLAYKGYRVLLYIRDISNYGDRGSLPKYHLSFCQTLETMRLNARWSRYVVANRDDGEFSINKITEGGKSEIKKLDICQNCLGKIQWKGFRNDIDRNQRLKFVNNFKLAEFFKVYPRDLFAIQPKHTSDTAPINDYPKNWGDISERFKYRTGYQCEKCQSHLSGLMSRYLHVHHKSGQKNECEEINLEALCIGCHAEEAMHSHMKSHPDYHEYARLRSAVQKV